MGISEMRARVTKMGPRMFVLLISLALAGQAAREEEIYVASLTTSVADFAYEDLSSGRGLHVVSSPDSLYISTMEGRCLIAADEASGESLRLITVGRTMFIQVKSSSGESQDFSVPDAYTGINNAELTVLRDLVRILNSSSSDQEVSHIRLWQSLLTILSYPEARLLQSAAVALGRRGVTGLDFPSVLPFYMSALQLSQLQGGNITAGSLFHDVTDDCLSQCPPCPYQECLGLCGYGCNCWKWVCGDCCYHLGCYEHDICCRKKFIRTACLLPFNFKCESGYTCN